MMNFKKIYLLLFFIFIQFSCFAILDEFQPQVHYDEKVYEKLKSFSKGESVDSNLFENENLRGISLNDTLLKSILFNKSWLDHSTFAGLSFEGNSKILNSNFSKTCFKDTFFYDSGIYSSKFIDVKIWSSIFNNFIILDSDFSKSTFLNCRFANMRINSKKGKKCFISGNKFNNALFKSCTFKWVGLRNNNFTRAKFDKTSFKKCFIIGADFSRAIFEDVLFEECIFVDCKSLDKIFFTGNVIFNFCEFVNTDCKNGYSDELIKTIKNLGATVIKKPGKWMEFKKVAGAMVGIASHLGNSVLSGLASEYARSIVSDCNKLCTTYLDQDIQLTTCSIN